MFLEQTKVVPQLQIFQIFDLLHQLNSFLLQCTLFLLELHLCSYAIAAGGERPFGEHADFLGAFLQIVVVFLGAIYRFWGNEGRTQYACNNMIGYLSFLLAVFVFALIGWNRLNGLDGMSECNDIRALFAFSLLQVGYPVVFFVAWIVLHMGRLKNTEYSYNLSAFKDVSLATLDVGVKAGLALYTILRLEWVVDDSFVFLQANCTA